MKDILAIDVGTTVFKMGIFSPTLANKHFASRRYRFNLYDQGKADIDPEEWWCALRDCCNELRDFLPDVEVISLSVTTPGLVPMDDHGRALGPAILFFDGRSRRQAKAVREGIGEDRLLQSTCNLPVTGGSSLASILWIKENQPEIWNRTAKFGHCNTYMVRRLTGLWAIDPSTTSITSLYNTAANDLTWNQEVLEFSGIPENLLPPLMHSYQAVGEILPAVAEELGLCAGTVVLCGGNDAVLAGLSSGITKTGVINNVNGTCEITTVCIDHPISSPNFNVRCHAIPGLWLTFFVLNTGGSALEWFHQVFCQDMSLDHFFEEYVPSVIRDFFGSAELDKAMAAIPEYTPYLQGSRYSVEPLTAGFQGLTLETSREMLLLSILKGNERYHADHLRELEGRIDASSTIIVTGGGAQIPGMIEVKKRWLGDYDYVYREQSSLLGAAQLAQMYQSGQDGRSPVTLAASKPQKESK